MSEKFKNTVQRFLIPVLLLVIAGTGSGCAADPATTADPIDSGYAADTAAKVDDTSSVVDFEHTLDDYVPAKTK